MNPTGISNRETPDQEEREREEHPPLEPEQPLPESAPQTRKVAGAFGEEADDAPEADRRGTSHPGRHRRNENT